tara:strand:- start:1303 stop:1572 length:270 start_codon:yes stop_codon:yes gene_type:complete
MKRKKERVTNRVIKNYLDDAVKMILSNKSSITVLSDFLFNYLEMKGETEMYTKFMEDKINGLMEQSSKGDGEILREPVQGSKEEKEEEE